MIALASMATEIVQPDRQALLISSHILASRDGSCCPASRLHELLPWEWKARRRADSLASHEAA